VLHAQPTSSSLLCSTLYTVSTVQTTKFLNLLFSPVTCYFFPLSPKYFLSTLFSNTPSFRSSLNMTDQFLISNFRRVLNVVCFLLGNSPESEFCINDKLYKIQTPGNYPEESIQHDRQSFTPIQSTIISLYITHTDRCFSQNQTLVCRVCTHCD
jgi:hypothetical protein